MKASIDIGTNTVLLLVAEAEGDRHIRVVEEQERTPRLGKNVDGTNILDEDAIARTIDVLLEFKSLLNKDYSHIEETVVTATSAVRDAGNRAYFLEHVKSETGFEVQVLSGSEEAQYAYYGAQSVLLGGNLNPSKTIIDIGGGSTEIALGSEGTISDYHSFDMGCVRYTERYLVDDPPTSGQIQSCKTAIADMLIHHPFEISGDTSLMGIAGTATSLAFIEQSLSKYDRNDINGYRISLNDLERRISFLQELSANEIRKEYQSVMEHRADIFLAGLLILEGFMNKYDLEEIVASTGGVRHGAILLA
ncbi:Ppx/GppA phosphatase [Fodinibius salinus]|uniref:Ppx/GppA phosphatase n=1 Tax=Fodinibius salinus TaxID=860790 RepID=A0A5D3YMX9_9BACT|nr:Ppx/GppA phosphatase family protein [Fodinibius salinus]TYP95147.1 Ppx/GppA phosphatase [Fodinibius salinus]